MGPEFCLSCRAETRVDALECASCKYQPPRVLAHPKIAERYRIVERLGAGSMGEVFLVESTTLANFRSALKVIVDARTMDQEYIRRFRSEAEIAAGVSSTRVAKLQYFDDCDGIPFALWDYVAGTTLADILRGEHALEVRRVVRLVSQLAQGLTDIHRSAVHRDIKPSNLILRDPGTPGEELYILDLGLAKAHADNTRSHQGIPPGTPRYMAPELFDNGPRQPHPTQDIYAAGIVFYELLLGVPPFAGETTYALAHSICTQEPMWHGPFTDHPLGGRLQAIARRALAKDPNLRYVRAAEFQHELLAVARGLDDVAQAWTVTTHEGTAVRSPETVLSDSLFEPYLSRASADFVEAESRFSRDYRQRALVHRRAVSMIEDLQLAAERLRGGELVTNYHDCSLLTECVEEMSAGDELLGLTTWEADRTWWRSMNAEAFRRANEHAIRKGASIRRIFVYDGFPEGSASLRELADEMERHACLGVQVRSLERRLLGLASSTDVGSQCTLSAPTASGRIPWLTYHVLLDTLQQPLHNVFSFRRDDLHRSAQRLETTWEHATTFMTDERRVVAVTPQATEYVCSVNAFGDCETPSPIVDESQLVSPGQLDGRRLYIHESSFAALAQLNLGVAKAVYSALVAVPVLKLIHHDIVQDAVFTSGFRAPAADSLQSTISRRWFTVLTDTFRHINVPPRGIHLKEPWIPLLGEDETIVATCFDSNYYTFATTDASAVRMYRDNTILSTVEQKVREGGDAYRDLTFVKGQRLKLRDPARFLQTSGVSWAAGGVSEEQLTRIKIRILADFSTELAEGIKAAIPSPTFEEAKTLRQFETKCESRVRQTVLRLSISSTGSPE